MSGPFSECKSHLSLNPHRVLARTPDASNETKKKRGCTTAKKVSILLRAVRRTRDRAHWAASAMKPSSSWILGVVVFVAETENFAHMELSSRGCEGRGFCPYSTFLGWVHIRDLGGGGLRSRGRRGDTGERVHVRCNARVSLEGLIPLPLSSTAL